MKSVDKNWVTYWDEIGSKLEKYLETQRIIEAEQYILCSLGFYSFMTEKFMSKVTKNKEIAHSLTPSLVQLHDLVRTCLFTQRRLLLSASAMMLRTGFEIRCNLNYIFQHQEPKLIANRLVAFFRYEQLTGAKQSPNLVAEDIKVEQAFAKEHPYWTDSKTGLLKNKVEWNGENKSLKDICTILKKDDEFFQFWKLPSKFVHGSPIAKNMFTSNLGLGVIPDKKHPTMFSLLAIHQIMEALFETCIFLGIDFPELDYRKIQNVMLKARDKVGF